MSTPDAVTTVGASAAEDAAASSNEAPMPPEPLLTDEQCDAVDDTAGLCVNAPLPYNGKDA